MFTSVCFVGFGRYLLPPQAVSVRLKVAAAASSNDPDVRATEAAWLKILGGADSDPMEWTRQIEKIFIDFDEDGDGGIGEQKLALSLLLFWSLLTRA